MGPTEDQSSGGSLTTRRVWPRQANRRSPNPSPIDASSRPYQSTDRFDQILDATLAAVRESLIYAVPAGGLRDYWLWGLDPATPAHREFVQVIGARQLCQLTVTLLDGLIDDDVWPELTRLSALMNVYQLFEIVSDNLAIGAPGSEAVPALEGFNTAMVALLSGSPADPEELLAGIEPPVRRLSGFTHSLAGPAHRRMSIAFAAERLRPTTRDIEYGLWPVLVGNARTARAVADRLALCTIGPVLRDGLINRYQAVNRTLSATFLPLFELATVGAHAILVAPTLCYFVGAMGEVLHPDPAFPVCVTDGTLPEALCDAALLVRLLNDIGPGLLTCTAAGRAEVWRQIWNAAAEYSTMEGLLLSDTVPSTVLTRLRKDLRHGEFNVALYGARRAASVGAAISSMASAVDYFSVLYGLHRARLRTGLAALADRLTDSRPLTLIERFVRFHENLYAHPYTEAAGEYAV